MRLHDLRVEAHNALAGRRRRRLARRSTCRAATAPSCRSRRCRRCSPTSDCSLRPRPSSARCRPRARSAARRRTRSRPCACTGDGLATEASASRATAAVEGAARYARGRLDDRDRSSCAPRAAARRASRAACPSRRRAASGTVDGIVESLDLAPLLALAGSGGSGPLNGRVRVEGPRTSPGAHAELAATARAPRQHGAGAGVARRQRQRRESEPRAPRRDARRAATSTRPAATTPRTRASRAARPPRGCAWRSCRFCRPRPGASTATLGASVTLSGTSETPAGELRACARPRDRRGLPGPGARADGALGRPAARAVGRHPGRRRGRRERRRRRSCGARGSLEGQCPA